MFLEQSLISISLLLAFARGQTYIGFVVDDTGSMRNELIGLKQWIHDCGINPNSICDANTYILANINEPVAKVISGPTSNLNVIETTVGSMRAAGGGDCREKPYTSLKEVIDIIPTINSGCKIYFFTDATAKDTSIFNHVKNRFQSKGCSAFPVLTGCCGKCSNACDVVSKDFCMNHVCDKTRNIHEVVKTGSTPSTSQPGHQLYYELAEATGGAIFIAEKPVWPSMYLDFLKEKLTMGFCPTSQVAGPLPRGYECEEDCLAMGMCWDRSKGRCYCKTGFLCPHAPTMLTQCPGVQEINCPLGFPARFIRDVKDCKKFYLCMSGAVYHFQCPSGLLFSEMSPTYCDQPKDIFKPCGSKEIDLGDIFGKIG